MNNKLLTRSVFVPNSVKTIPSIFDNTTPKIKTTPPTPIKSPLEAYKCLWEKIHNNRNKRRNINTTLKKSKTLMRSNSQIDIRSTPAIKKNYKLRLSRRKFLQKLNTKFQIPKPKARFVPRVKESSNSKRKRGSLLRHQSMVNFRTPQNQWKINLSKVLNNRGKGWGENLRRLMC
mmetsp:Transcript_21002/g.18628  ORF Transcript_21002/g.18628 Transcript_21002/m.18628 type:complete len:175 (-) Transcript_21002:49-573(-)